MDKLTSTKKIPIKHDWTVEDRTEYRRKIVREAQRKRRARAKEQGLCLVCVKNPAAAGRVTCDECYSRVLEWQRGQKNEKQSI